MGGQGLLRSVQHQSKQNLMLMMMMVLLLTSMLVLMMVVFLVNLNYLLSKVLACM